MRMQLAVMSLVMGIALGVHATPIEISVTGTADSAGMGYTEGESCTFTWTLNGGYDGGSYDSFDSSINYWSAGTTSDPWLWSDVSGDGLSGTYSRPSGTSGAPYDYMRAFNYNDGLYLYAGNNDPSSSSMGLTVNGVELLQLGIDGLTATGLNLDYSDTSFVNPATWADEYAGTYNSGVSDDLFYVQDENGNQTDFTATSFEIAAVPEPASIAMLGVASALGLFIRRRFLV